jgi:cytochrome c biogenesis protein CcmG/thiol:disulfide interchange protein DsbE
MTDGRNARGRWILAGALALALGFAALPAGLRFFDRSDASAETGTPAGLAPAFCDSRQKPANLSFTVKDMNGRDVRWAAYKGQVILLNFWATWCGPCKAEIPGFVDVYNRYRDDGFVVLGLSTDDTPEQLRKFASQYKMTYPVLVGSDRSDITDDAYGPLWGIPVSFLIARDGTICKRYPGLVHKEQLERELKALM